MIWAGNLSYFISDHDHLPATVNKLSLFRNVPIAHVTRLKYVPSVCPFRLPSDQRTKSRVQNLLTSGKGSVRDKLRLLGVYCLAVRPSTAEVTELEGLLKQSAASSGVDGAEQEAERGLGAIAYLRQQAREAPRGRHAFR